MVQVDDLKLGALILIPQKAGIASPLPLEHTAVDGTITGPVASVTVTQRFGNPFNHPIELEYLFPLPEKGAVVDYEITIGTRTIKADIKERETARQVYQQAVSEGKRASLLEQRRPNLFSIEIGNVQPGESIITKLTYEDRLKYSDGSYEFVFPMGITPRYHTHGTSEGEMNAVDSPVELDNSKISKVEITLAVDAGVDVREPRSRTHPVALTRKNDREFGLMLEGDQIPNKDFVLEYAVAEEHLQTAVWSSHDEDSSDTVLVTLLPPKLDISAEPPAREFIFVIDRSGSMSRDPMEQAKNALRACIRALGEHDTFTIAAFDNSTEWFSNKPVAVTQENVNQADTWIAQIHSRGGTEILGALQQALAIPTDNERQRYLVFLTDGAVSAEDRVLKEIAAKRGDARLFSFGIGPSVNRFMLNKMAEIGRGTADFMGANDDIEGMMTRFQDKVSYPALLDVQISWQGAETWDSYPSVLPDVYAGEPLELTTRLARQGSVKLNVSGKRNNQPMNMTVEIPKADSTNPTLRRIWARARVESLEDENVRGSDAEKIRQQIISLGLAHRLVTRYTSFVAVDSEVTESTQDSQKVNVSVPLPEGLDPEGFGLSQPGFAAAQASYYAPPSASITAYRLSSPTVEERRRRLLGGDDSDGSQGGGLFNRVVGSVKSLFGGDDKREEIDNAPEEKARGYIADDAGDSSLEREYSKAWLPDIDSMSLEEKQNLSDENLSSTAATLKRKYEEFAKAAQEGGEQDSDELILRGKNELAYAAQAELNTKQELAQEYYEQWQYFERLRAAKKQATIEANLKSLARTQNVNGSWHDDLEMTAAAVLAFVRAGHTTRTGNYRQQVKRAATYLSKQLEVGRATGFALFAGVRALDELHAASGDFAVPDTVRASLPNPASNAERAALGQGAAPSTVTTLDDLRVKALLEGTASAPQTLTQGVDSQRVQAWLAVGKPS